MAADIAEREAQAMEAQLAERRRGAPEQRRAVYCLNHRLREAVPKMGTNKRWDRISQLMHGWTGESWTVRRVRVAVLRIQKADEKWRAGWVRNSVLDSLNFRT